MTGKKKLGVAYFRISSAANVGTDKDSERRQSEAVRGYARAAGVEIVAEFYDVAVLGADPIDVRPGFVQLLDHCADHGIGLVLVENAGRFARALAVQLAGHQLLRQRGIELVPTDAQSYFTDPSPTAELVRQILGAVAQFEKAALVAKLRHARDRIRAERGRCEGRKPVAPGNHFRCQKARQAVAKNRPAAKLARHSYRVGRAWSCRPAGRPYFPASIARMLAVRSAC
jgi:DNA invertase Pin-like site-specific DNA recombinase